jgi:hypothetical protein
MIFASPSQNASRIRSFPLSGPGVKLHGLRCRPASAIRFSFKAGAKVDTFSFPTNFFDRFLCYKIYILSWPIPYINAQNSFFER